VDPEPLGGDRYPTRMIARRKSDYAPRPLFGRELQEPVGGTAQLEGPSGLKALAFEPDFDAPNLAFDQRSAFDEPRDPLGRFDNVISGDDRRFR
jgi:hypothetical protein